MFDDQSNVQPFGSGLPLSSARLIVGFLLFSIGPAALSADYTSCDADVNGDGKVNFIDLAVISSQFFSNCSGGCTADIDGNGDVDFADLAVIKTFFFDQCEPEPPACPPCRSYFDGTFQLQGEYPDGCEFGTDEEEKQRAISRRMLNEPPLPCDVYRFNPGRCPAVTLPDGTMCNKAITTITITPLPPE